MSKFKKNESQGPLNHRNWLMQMLVQTTYRVPCIQSTRRRTVSPSMGKGNSKVFLTLEKLLLGPTSAFCPAEMSHQRIALEKFASFISSEKWLAQHRRTILQKLGFYFLSSVDDKNACQNDVAVSDDASSLTQPELQLQEVLSRDDTRPGELSSPSAIGERDRGARSALLSDLQMYFKLCATNEDAKGVESEGHNHMLFLEKVCHRLVQQDGYSSVQQESVQEQDSIARLQQRVLSEADAHYFRSPFWYKLAGVFHCPECGHDVVYSRTRTISVEDCYARIFLKCESCGHTWAE